MKIKFVNAIEMLDSRGNPTVKAYIELKNGIIGSALVPSGASTGRYEAVELRDGDGKRYGGKGVLNAVNNIKTEIAEAISGMDARDQEKIDKKMIELDGTDNKSRLGANAILAVSLAVARAGAISSDKPLYEYLNGLSKGEISIPIPQMNIMNGGRHANWAADIQEYMLIPQGKSSFKESLRMCSEIYASLEEILRKNGQSTNVGDEGGFAPAFNDNKHPFSLMSEAVIVSGYSLGEDVAFGIDSAASEFYKDGKYLLKKENKEMSSSELLDFYKEITNLNHVSSIEDPFAEDDWKAFSDMTLEMGNKIQIVGDDLYATNVSRISRGIEEKATNAVLIKLNQIGTLTETIEAIKIAKESGQKAIISHRSGETEDSFIADLAVATGTGQIKAGAPARSERTAKYNRLLEIERELEL
ncbi:MAG: phosphopyruvate hydratase [Candidatus Colwellbacteria bacterium]|jgi:enolase|nr:phosphopyruvate hydratase [Candidatus Colwellbacteria bacterium]MCK9497549.1 phosphopyruvate hydratase [Candidatus Colwellbacteria bacterium]MDD3752735.1 phosphopyruvate hydratase [Candidatus Colwellbacteria bacterium]MDD4818914.1 phosphopyruvate hydratase [Candidatus Colwellbacteria bacterium]